MYNTSMMYFSQEAGLDDPDISELKARLSKLSWECMIYLKCVIKALLFIQENYGLPSDLDKLRFEKGGADFGL